MINSIKEKSFEVLSANSPMSKKSNGGAKGLEAVAHCLVDSSGSPLRASPKCCSGLFDKEAFNASVKRRMVIQVCLKIIQEKDFFWSPALQGIAQCLLGSGAIGFDVEFKRIQNKGEEFHVY